MVATDLTGAQLILWPGTGNKWYGFRMNASTLNYNTPGSVTYEFYCGTTVYVHLFLLVVQPSTMLRVVPTLSHV